MKKQSNAEENIERFNAALDTGLTSEQVENRKKQKNHKK